MAGILNEIAPIFRPYVQTLIEDLKLGLCKTKVDFERISGCSDGVDNQFRLVLPYCSKKLKWEVIFDPTCPWFAPDFRFDDETFLSNVDDELLETKLPSLYNWNETSPSALTDVISELIDLYKTHQVNKLNEDESSRALFEYSALVGDTLTAESDVEVWVGGHVEFLIRLNIQTSTLPELYTKDVEENPGVDSALLLVRYPNSTNAELILSPQLSKCLGNITLPPMHQSGVLMDYVPMVTELLNNKIEQAVRNERLKRALVSRLAVRHEGALLERDARSAAFLFNSNGFHYILHIEIGEGFPEKPPVLTLRSVYHSSKGKPRFKVLPSCPYNNFERYIEQQVEIFKNECKGTLHNQDVTME